jgi:predicted PurR-regulated permease PerM
VIRDGREQPEPAARNEGSSSAPSMPSGTSRTDMPDWWPWAIAAVPLAVLLSLLLIRFFSAITGVLTLLLFAEFIALALEPGVTWFARRGWKRGTATGLLMAMVSGVIVASFILIVPPFISQLASIFDQAPELIASLADKVGIDVSTQDIQSAIESNRESLANLASDLASNVVNITGAVLGAIGNIFTVGLLAFYLTAEAPRVRRSVLTLFGQRRQEHVLQLWEISIDKVGGYLYSRALMALLSGTFAFVILLILDVPFAAPLAIFVGFISQFVPVVGTYIAYALPIAIALASGGFGDAIVLLVFALIYQQLENLFINPRLSAKTMQLHPAIAFVAALIGGSIGGVAMAFLSLPIAAIIQAFGSTFLIRHDVVASDLTTDESSPPPEVTPEREHQGIGGRIKEMFSRMRSD